VLAVAVVGDLDGLRQLDVLPDRLAVTGGQARARQRLVGVGEVPVVERVALTELEAAIGVEERLVGPPGHGVGARDLPCAARAILRLAFRRECPVVGGRVRAVDHQRIVLAGLDQAPRLVEQVHAELPMVDHVLILHQGRLRTKPANGNSHQAGGRAEEDQADDQEREHVQAVVAEHDAADRDAERRADEPGREKPAAEQRERREPAHGERQHIARVAVRRQVPVVVE